MKTTAFNPDQSYERLDFKQFLSRVLGQNDLFITDENWNVIYNLFKEGFSEGEKYKKSLFAQRGTFQKMAFGSMYYYQKEVGIIGPKHTDVDKPAFVFSVDNAHYLYNGYHRASVKMLHGETGILSYVLDLRRGKQNEFKNALGHGHQPGVY